MRSLRRGKRSSRANFILDPTPSPQTATEKSRSPSSSRRASVASIATRSPLAPLDPQSASTTSLSLSGDQIMSSSSSSHSGGSVKDVDLTAQEVARRTIIGRQIIPTRGGGEEDESVAGLGSPNRKRSIVTGTLNISATSTTTPSRGLPPPPPTPNRRPTSRGRDPHTIVDHHQTAHDPARRPSLPAIHLRAPSSISSDSTAVGSPVLHAIPDSISRSPPATSSPFISSDDLYAGLTAFSFGASASSPLAEVNDSISPLTSGQRPSVDRTPRASVSGPTRSRGMIQQQQPDTDSDRDEEEASRRRRSKMWAVDDGTRRPSLPTNDYSNRQVHGETLSEGEGEHDFDTDGETDGLGIRRDMLISDTASQHTFGGDGQGSGFDSMIDLHHPAAGLGEGGGSHSSETPSPVTFYREYGDTDDEVFVISDSGHKRRGSLPMAIPGASAGGSGVGGRDREGSLATLRRPSRSLDDDLRMMNAGVAGMDINSPSSEPQTRADWRSFEDADHEPLNAYDGFDLKDFGNYPSQEMQDGRDRQPSIEGFDFAGWGQAMTGGSIPARRPSTMTISTYAEDDTFARHIRKTDPRYASREIDWSFRKELADGSSSTIAPSGKGIPPPVSSPVGMPVNTQEIWRNEHVGRFKVDRIEVAAESPKPPQQRLNVIHITDPYSKGNRNGGPDAVIHKHSKAQAYSIFRCHGLLKRRQGSKNMSMTDSILLAQKRVQEAYTNTRSTGNLQTYGLLENRPTDHRNGTGWSQRNRSAGRKGTERPEKDKKKDKDKAKKDKGDDGWDSQASQASTSTSATLSERVRAATPPSERYPPGVQQTSPRSTRPSTSREFHSDSYDRSMNQSMDYSTSPAFAEIAHRGPTAMASRGRADSMDLDDEDQPPPRTSHAEAFATLPLAAIESVRAKANRVDHHGGSSRFGSVFNQKNTHKPANPPASASIEGQFRPPWLTMVSRSTLETEEHKMQTLNDSFKGVGLLPNFKPKPNRTRHRPGSKGGIDIFENVPDTSLYMLLPLWPGEIDVKAPCPVALEDRQYLLVYYIPPEQRDANGKKRGRAGKSSSSTLLRDKHANLDALNVCARLLGYDDLRNTGVRLPAEGLSVTGPISEAVKSIPPPSVRAAGHAGLVIGVCKSRDRGIELIPEGLDKLGLSKSVLDNQYSEEIEFEYYLTTIGRAAVEMAWLGSMALMSFSDV
ncbi:hypothetical protein JAAARDRAFT_208596 [Jaapia argillacea MUCL 33604]|uniref:Uncharacterized protein n=1 Tax=Jaapia argillacea MUCL 33604 TaxID=933084 RepID=A0A067PX14_9AGAM|nr:hypothetical protein JAAARDRAFT_208596 [Jaapia argillacea MUCL 33604]